MSKIYRDSNFLDDIEFGKRGSIMKKASKNAGVPKKIKKLFDTPAADTPEEAKNVLHKFDDSPDIPNEYINEHLERIEKGENARDVMTDFFKGLNEAKTSNKEISIITAKAFRQTGMFKKTASSRDLYQDLKTGDFWKISEDGKTVVRMFKEVDGLATE